MDSPGQAGNTLNSFETGYGVGLPQNTNGIRDFNKIACGYINSDSNIDIAFGGEDYSTANTKGLYAYTGNGNGTWTSASSGLPSYSSWGGVALGDADGDGKIELYAGDEGWGSRGGTISGVGAWEYSSGSWSTTGITSPLTSGYYNDVVLKNFTKNSRLDLAITSSRTTSSGIKVFYGNSSATSGWTSNSNGLPTSGEYAGIAVEDLNNDSLPDIAAVSYGSVGLKFFTQNSNGNGWTDRTSSLPSSAKTGRMLGVAIGDVNEDGHADVLFTTRDSGMKMLLGNSGGTGGTNFVWTTPTGGFPSNYGSSGRFPQIQLDDLDKDGDLDLLAPKAGTGLHLFTGNGSDKPGSGFGWTLVSGKGLPTNMTCYGSAFLDIDNDRDLDLAVATWGDGVKIYRTNLTEATKPNNPPIPDAGSDRTVRIGANVTLDGTSSTDPEDAPNGDTTGSKLTYEWNVTTKPAGSTINDSSLKPSDRTAKPYLIPDKEGLYTFNLSVKDSMGKWSNLSDEDQVKITVINDAPIPDAGSNQVVIIGKDVTLNGTASNDTEDAPDGDTKGNILTYDWNVTSKPSGSSINDLSLKPNDKNAKPYFYPDMEGDYTFKLSVKDTYKKCSNLADESVVNITVTNDAPVPDAGDDQTVYLGHNVTLNGTASMDPQDAPDGDQNGTLLSYDWNVTKYPIGSLIRDSSLMPSDNSAMPTFDPDKVGKYEITLAVNDSFGKWSNGANESKVLVNVLKPNDPPVADAGVDKSRYVNTSVFLNGTKSFDIDGTIEHWNWTSISHAIDLTNTDSAEPFFYPDSTGTYTFTLSVQDDNSTWSVKEDIVNITIVEPWVNLPPSADAGLDRQIILGEILILNGSESEDMDGEIILWNWTCTSHPGIVLLNLNSSHPSFTPEEAGTYRFTLTVMDDNLSYSEPDEVIIEVEEPYVNSIPVAIASENVTAYVGDLVVLDGSESYDHDGIIVEFKWTCINRTVNLQEDNSSKPRFTPSEQGDYIFTLSVLDNGGAWSIEDVVIVTVLEKYIPPPPIQNVTPYIGPFIYTDGSPVINANITLSPEDEWPWGSNWTVSTSTMMDGYAFFGMGLPPGNYSCSASLENGSLIGVFSIEIFADSSFLVKNGTLPEASLPPAGDDDDDDIEPVDDDDVEPVDDDDIEPADDDDDDIEPVDDDDTEPVDDDTEPADDDDDTSSKPEENSSQSKKIFFIGIIILIIVVVVLGVVINRIRGQSTDNEEEVPDLLIPQEPLIETTMDKGADSETPVIKGAVSEPRTIRETTISETVGSDVVDPPSGSLTDDAPFTEEPDIDDPVPETSEPVDIRPETETSEPPMAEDTDLEKIIKNTI